MPAPLRAFSHGETPVPAKPRGGERRGDARPARLADCSKLSSVAIETTLASNLSGDLHTLFDPVSDDVLPIYFGPLLGRLYLEGL